LSGAPSIVTTDALNACPAGVASSATSQPYSLRGDEVLPTGVVEEKVESAVALQGGIHDRRRIAWFADVANHERAVGPDLLGCAREDVGSAARDHDARATTSKLGRSRLAEVRPASCDDRDPAVQRAVGKRSATPAPPTLPSP
jgi:hypothetical protein